MATAQGQRYQETQFQATLQSQQASRPHYISKLSQARDHLSLCGLKSRFALLEEPQCNLTATEYNQGAANMLTGVIGHSQKSCEDSQLAMNAVKDPHSCVK